MIHKKHLDIISQINNDTNSISITKHETDLLDIKTELISLKKAIEGLQQTMHPDKLSNQVNQFKLDIDNVIKSIKHDVRSDKFESRMLNMQTQIDEIIHNSQGLSGKFESKNINKLKHIDDINHVNIEVQRLSDGLNNLYNFTQA